MVHRAILTPLLPVSRSTWPGVVKIPPPIILFMMSAATSKVLSFRLTRRFSVREAKLLGCCCSDCSSVLSASRSTLCSELSGSSSSILKSKPPLSSEGRRSREEISKGIRSWIACSEDSNVTEVDCLDLDLDCPSDGINGTGSGSDAVEARRIVLGGTPSDTGGGERRKLEESEVHR
jgi:hypothetical protein